MYEMDIIDNGNLMNSSISTMVMGFLAGYSLFIMIVGLLVIIELWLIYKKCGKPGWATIVPIYNVWVLFEISGLPGWLCLIPVANMIGMLVAYFKIPKKFGKGTGFSIGTLFLPIIFLGILAFSKATADGKINDAVNDNDSSSMEIPVPQSVPENFPVSEPNINNNVNASSDTLSESIPSPMPDLMAVQTENVSNNEINEVVPEKQFIAEEPALNLQETQEAVTTSVAEPIMSNSTVQQTEPIINIFDMPAPVMHNQTVNELSNNNIDANTKNNIDILNVGVLDNVVETSPVENDIETSVLPEITPAYSSPTMPFDNLDVNSSAPVDIMAAPEEIELPKMVNEAINSDITVVKKCAVCGFDNQYSNKTCEKCGSVLE